VTPAGATPSSRPRSPLRLAYFSPLPPARSGIADYSRELLPHLAQHATLTLFAPDPAQVDGSLRSRFTIQPLHAYAEQCWQVDTAIYQMGNSTHHEALYAMMRRYPGVLVLHDYVLHHFIADRTAGRGNYPAYTREMGYELGARGIDEAWAIRQGERPHRLAAVPLNRRLVDLSLGVIVHSRYMQQRLQGAHPARPVWLVPAPIQSYGDPSRRADLPRPRDALIFASFGQVTPGKQLARALRAFARLRERVPQARYLIAGEVEAEVDLPALLDALQLRDAVHHTGFVDDLDAFLAWMNAADVVVNLRHPTLGETSATALRALAAGRPLVVYDHGWYAELPDAAAVKVPPLDEEALYQAMLRLALAPEERSRLSQAARAYAATHRPERTAAAYAEAIRRILEWLSHA
jgi:glycosyltransferase involved in cell wall biosynthesis